MIPRRERTYNIKIDSGIAISKLSRIMIVTGYHEMLHLHETHNLLILKYFRHLAPSLLTLTAWYYFYLILEIV